MTFCNESKPFRYPERVKAPLLASAGLTYGDGSRVSPEEIWEFMTVSGPRRFPGLFSVDRVMGGPSPDVDFLTGIKRHYWMYNNFTRSMQRQRQGTPVVAIQPGGPLEVHYAAQCMVERPGFPLMWTMFQQEGLSRPEMQRRRSVVHGECSKNMPAECCSIVAPFRAVYETGCPIDFVAPVAMTACSDAIFTMEATRRTSESLPAFVVDFPANAQAGSWRAVYLAEQLRLLAAKLGQLSGVTVDDETLRAEIRRQNQLRQLARECTELWWSAEVPPTNSGDFFLFNSADQYNFPVVRQLLQETLVELRQRVAQRRLGVGLQRNPLRVFVCGSCAMPNSYLIEQCGGVVVGHEQMLGFTYSDVGEDGDPFLRLAESTCAMPYELPPEQRAAWTAEKVRQSRAEGVIFIYNWGCNYQSTIARAACDVMRQQANVPTLVLDVSPKSRVNSTEQMRTRVEAFLEMLRHKRVSR